MRPKREAPRLVADEVGMVIGDAEVVNQLDLPRRQQIDDRQPVAVRVEQLVADGEIPGCDPYPALSARCFNSATAIQPWNLFWPNLVGTVAPGLQFGHGYSAVES